MRIGAEGTRPAGVGRSSSWQWTTIARVTVAPANIAEKPFWETECSPDS
jgi:hypothetical protein